MSKFCTLLTRLVTAAAASSASCAQAQDVVDPAALTTRLSGFATTTVFGDNDWHPNTKSVALNFDTTYEDWAARGQAASSYEQPIRRLVIEHSFPYGPGHDVVIQAGRFPRLDSFYNSVTDAPSSWGLAMLPPGQYNRRMIGNRTFTGIEGVSVAHLTKIGEGLLRVHGDYGRTVVERQCDTQIEATKMPCRDGLEIDGARGSMDLGATYVEGNWTVLAYYGKLNATTKLLDPSDRVSKALTSQADRILYDAAKIGVKYDDGTWYAQTEVLHNTFKLAKTKSQLVTKQESWNVYLLGGLCLDDGLCTYAEYSRGTSSTITSGANDRAVGATYSMGDATYSLEYHRGLGKSWERYFAISNNWSTWVMSASWRF